MVVVRPCGAALAGGRGWQGEQGEQGRQRGQGEIYPSIQNPNRPLIPQIQVLGFLGQRFENVLLPLFFCLPVPHDIALRNAASVTDYLRGDDALIHELVHEGAGNIEDVCCFLSCQLSLGAEHGEFSSDLICRCANTLLRLLRERFPFFAV